MRYFIPVIAVMVIIFAAFSSPAFAGLDEGKTKLLTDMDIVGAHAEFGAATDQITSFWRAATIAADNDLLKNKLQALGIFNASNKLDVFDAEGEDNFNAEAAVGNIILDNALAEYSGAWGTLTSSDSFNPYGDDCLYHATGGTGADTVTWTPSITTPGYYDVCVWVIEAESNTESARYRINHAGGYTDITISQKEYGRARWYNIGEYQFTAGTAGSIVLSGESSTGRVVADAVKLEYQGIIVDDTDAGLFGLSGGGWETVTGEPDRARYGNYRRHPAGTGAGASWTVGIPDTGVDYLVYVTIPPIGSLSDDVTYTIGNVVGGPVKTIHVDQNKGQGGYCLGMFRFTSATGTVTLDSSASGQVVADAIRIVPCKPYPDLTEIQTIDNDLLTEIDAAILDMSNLDDVTKNFSDVINSSHCPGMEESLYIDYGDAKMLEAVLYLTRMYIKMNAAYEQAGAEIQPLIVNEGDLNTVMRILDDHTGLFTPLGGASVALGEAKTALINAIDSYTLAAEFINNRVDSNDHLVTFYSNEQTQEERDEAREIEENFRDLLADIRANLMDPDNNPFFTINFFELFGTDEGPDGVYLDVNLDALFSSPKNIRSYIDMLKGGGLIFDNVSNPTLDGVLPNMGPEDWNYLFGNGPEISDVMVMWSGSTPSVSIEWDKSQDPNAGDIDHYKIYRGTNSSMTDGVSIGTVNSPDTTQFTDTSLPSTGNTFYYRVYTYYDDAIKGTAATYTESEKAILRLYVNIGNSSGVEDGSMEHPYKELGETIHRQAKAGTWIRVARGTYNEDSQSLSMWNRSGLVLEGGYDPATWTRNIELNETIIDAIGRGDWAVIGLYNTTGNVIDGFTLTNGIGQNYTNGVGMNKASSVTIRNCKITNCNNGIAIENSSSILIENCQVYGRKAFSAGGCGISMWDNSAARIYKSVFKDFWQHGISISQDCSADIEDCDISQNIFYGINAQQVLSLSVKGSRITQNTGMGIFFYQTAAFAQADIFNNIVAQNGSKGICVESNGIAAASIINNTVVSNGVDAGVKYQNMNSVIIRNNIICSNGNGFGVTQVGTTPATRIIENNNSWNNLAANYYNCGTTAGSNGNISADPVFDGGAGSYYLNQASSPCINTGIGTSASLGLDNLTTSTAQLKDTGVVDMGYHYAVVIPTDTIIDNSDPNCALAGSWTTTNASSGYYGANYAWSAAGTGSSTATWTPNIPVDGNYEILIKHSNTIANRATNAPYTVSYYGGQAPVAVNLTKNGGQWISLGTYSFKAGSAGYVRLTNKADNKVEADAVKFVYKNSYTDTIIDNSDPNCALAGSWTTTNASSGYYGANYAWSAAGTGSSTATWTPNIPVDGNYEILIKHSNTIANRATNAPYTVSYYGGQAPVAVNLTKNGGQWISLGTYSFKAGSAGYVRLTNKADNKVEADAVKFVYKNSYTDTIIDNSDPNCALAGSWTTTNASSGYYGANYAWSAAGTGSSTATWTPNIPVDGNYEILIKHSNTIANRATNAPYTVSYYGGQAPVAVNLTKNGGQWISLGTYSFKAGSAGYVRLTNKADNKVEADAVKFVYKNSYTDTIIDNSDPNCALAGSWTTTNASSGYYGANYAWSAAGTGSSTATWTPNIPVDGNYEILIKHSNTIANRATNAPYTVSYYGGQAPVAVNLTKNGGQWISLGTYSFKAGSAGYVRLTNKADNKVEADAVKFVYKI